jgi:hypothetical protein
MKIQTVIITVILIAIGAMGFSSFNKSIEPSLKGINDSACSVTSTYKAVVGNQLTSTVLSAASNRAYARISLVTNDSGVATSSVYLNFDEGTAATSNNMRLSTTTPYYEFGRNTDMPYTGAITGLTTTGSTTVNIIECLY